jgi:hypothetical protein
MKSSDKEKVVIFGISQLASLAHFYFTHDSNYETVAFTVDQAYLSDTTYHDLPVVPFEDILERKKWVTVVSPMCLVKLQLGPILQ